MKKSLIIFALCLHILFYISALKTHTLDYFFSWGNVHEWQGLDFYQIPNGAYAYLRGGKLSGEIDKNIPPYSYTNRNVYHPFFTLLTGTPLQIFPPSVSIKIWLILHALITLSILLILYSRFKKNRNFILAIFIFLIFFPQYLEIWNGQYHFILDASIFLILLYNNPLAYTLSLLVKPITILWLPTLFIKKQFRFIIVGLGLFTLVTVPFFINGDGLYYIQNLFERMRSPIGGPPGIFNLDSLVRFWQIPFYKTTIAKIFFALAIFAVQIRLKLNLFQSLFVWISYYLLFYDFVFEYHYTTLIPFLVLGILTQKPFQKKFAKFLAVMLSLPTPFFLMHFFQIGAVDHKVTNLGWTILVLFKIVPLIMLNIFILYKNFPARLKPRTNTRDFCSSLLF